MLWRGLWVLFQRKVEPMNVENELMNVEDDSKKVWSMWIRISPQIHVEGLMKRRRRSSMWVRFICFVGEGGGKLAARWRRGEEGWCGFGFVWERWCVCFSHVLFIISFFFLISLIIRVELTILKINKNQKIYRWHDT